MVVSAVQPEKEAVPIVVTEGGTTIDTSELQS